MGLNITNGGDRNYIKARTTSEQTGNHAPRPHWPYALRLVILMSAYHLGFTDERMATSVDRPNTADLERLVLRTCPWAPEWYRIEQERLCAEKNYAGATTPLTRSKIMGRLKYFFEKPGRKKRTRSHQGPSDRPIERSYGISPEHPMSPQQHAKGRLVWVACSEVIERRIKMSEQVSLEEVMVWSSIAGVRR